MLDLLLILGFVVFNFLVVLVGYKLFGLRGLATTSVFFVLISNILVLKRVDVFGLAVPAGALAIGATFLITDIIGEFYSKEKAKQIVHITFFANIVWTLGLTFALYLPTHATDFSKNAMELLFTPLPRIALGGLIAFYVSQLIDVQLFHLLKNKFPNQLWIRNNGSTIVSQAIDTVLFLSIAFLGTLPFAVLGQMMIGMYSAKLMFAVLDTVIIYIIKHKKSNAEGVR
ncbi:queuosine precursor transporter [Haloplasma contractile]|uniref:Probable queuosine precursor transporter n=1 Tax=Haloplasma contractile SSD-17B TaxID=1033810 RepID=F7Q0Y6_9MOLU|nr:queuosine precursor transporter [Haloplasma contractile]ERJ11327.1 Transporter protein [Haloplasma contractile SSD-17B]